MPYVDAPLGVAGLEVYFLNFLFWADYKKLTCGSNRRNPLRILHYVAIFNFNFTNISLGCLYGSYLALNELRDPVYHLFWACSLGSRFD